MHQIEQSVKQIQYRQRLQSVWTGASGGLLAGGVLGTVLSVTRLVFQIRWPWLLVLLTVVVPAIGGVVWGLLRSPSLLETARRVDRGVQLKDRLQTAIQFLQLKTRTSAHQLAIDDAEQRLAGLQVEQVSPVIAPNTWPSALISAVLAFGLMILAVAPSASRASATTAPVISEQAAALQQSLDQLEELKSDEADPELDRMLKEMNRQVALLREPGMKPEEAMATLSDMDAALQDMQKQLRTSSSEASLKEVGEALALAEATAEAGKALQKGDLEKAAEELKKTGLPDLDRKTQTAVREKLDKTQQTAKKAVSEAAKKLSEGMASKDEKSFNEGKSDLAVEAQREAKRQELRKQLQKQSQKLMESKGALESAMQVPSSNSKDGNTPAPGNQGKKAGKGTQGNQKGDATESKKGTKELKLTGQDSLTGETDKEKEQSTEDDSQAVREYRQNADKYEALNESAMESELIPPGHRQTIRRYFELIRPTNDETDGAKP